VNNREAIKTNIPLALGVIAVSAGLASRPGRRQVPGRRLEHAVKPFRHEEMRDHPQAAEATGKDH
jgi:hypothetical protein